jgi:hypothetical protein
MQKLYGFNPFNDSNKHDMMKRATRFIWHPPADNYLLYR